MSEPSTAVIHFYRASSAHADVWRERLDITTNWAIVTNAAILSFALSNPQTPHFVLLMVLFVDLFFLIMESRRYQVYNMWHHRVRVLQQYVFAEALSGHQCENNEAIQENLSDLAEHLGDSTPRISLTNAIGFRIRRNYFYILLFTIGAWLVKLQIHPAAPASFGEYIARAHMGPFSGSLVFSCVILLLLSALGLAISAPSDSLVNWRLRPSPLQRALPQNWFGKGRQRINQRLE